MKLKLNKSVDELKERLDTIEEVANNDNREETDYEIEAKFAKLREARAKKTNAHGDKTYEDVWDEITQEELDYYKRKQLETPPEQRYQHKKEHWDFYDSSWSMRRLNRYDGQGCNQFSGCVPHCRYYPEEGRIEDEEVLGWFENKRRRILD